jgi:hypothetical protein
MASRSLTNFETFIGTVNKRRKQNEDGNEGRSLADVARWFVSFLPDRTMSLEQLTVEARGALGLEPEQFQEAVRALIEKQLLETDPSRGSDFVRLTPYAQKALSYFSIA